MLVQNKVYEPKTTSWLSNFHWGIEVKSGPYGGGYFYTRAGYTNGGHFSWREAKLQACALTYGCVKTYYPHIDFWARGDGTYTWAWSKS